MRSLVECSILLLVCSRAALVPLTVGIHGASATTGWPNYQGGSRLLIVEAEDLGMAHSVDKATFEALDKGWVTSASVLTPAPWFPEVAFWANQHRQADLGVQLDLTSDWKSYCWRAVSPQAAGSSLLDSTGYFPLSEAYVARHAKPDEVVREGRAQIELALKTGPCEKGSRHAGRLNTRQPSMMDE
jgi:hypothetical protein